MSNPNAATCGYSFTWVGPTALPGLGIAGEGPPPPVGAVVTVMDPNAPAETAYAQVVRHEWSVILPTLADLQLRRGAVGVTVYLAHLGEVFVCGVCGERCASEAAIRRHIATPDVNGVRHDGDGVLFDMRRSEWSPHV